jgi:hypothetical protein
VLAERHAGQSVELQLLCCVGGCAADYDVLDSCPLGRVDEQLGVHEHVHSVGLQAAQHSTQELRARAGARTGAACLLLSDREEQQSRHSL